MDEPNRTPLGETEGATSEPSVQPEASASPAAQALESAFARGSGQMSEVAPERSERSEHSIMEGLPQAKAERVAAMRRELAELQRQLIEAQQKIATELQGRADDAERFEALETRLQAQEAEAQEHGARVAELEAELAPLREAKALLETRDAELTTITSERDAVKGERDALKGERDALKSERDALKSELEQARGELDATRAKTRDIATQLVRFSQGLTDGAAAEPTMTSEPEPKPAAAPPPIAAAPPVVAAAERPLPPPVPVQRTKPKTQEIELLEVRDEEKAPPARTGLLVFVAVVLSSLATIGIMKLMSANAAEASHDQGVATSPAPVVAPVAQPEPAPTPAPMPPPVAEPSPSAAAPLVEPDVNARPGEAPVVTPPPPTTPAAEVATDGILLLPEEAEGHRLYVDGRVMQVKQLRATVRCGTREIQIGSRGTARKVEVTCGGETAIAADPSDR